MNEEKGEKEKNEEKKKDRENKVEKEIVVVLSHPPFIGNLPILDFSGEENHKAGRRSCVVRWTDYTLSDPKHWPLLVSGNTSEH